MKQALLFASLLLAGKKQNPNSQMFSRLLNASHQPVKRKQKTKNKKHCDWFETGGIPGTFSPTFSGGAEPGWACRPETSAAAFPSDDAFTYSSEREAAGLSQTQCRGNIFSVVATSRCSFDSERLGLLLLFSPVIIGLLFGYFLKAQRRVYEYDLAFY